MTGIDLKTFILGGIVICLLACTNVDTSTDQQQTYPEFTTDKDYFPDKGTIAYAENFSVEYRKNYKVVRAKVGFGAAAQDTDSLAWEQAFTDLMVLVQRGTPPHPSKENLPGHT